MTVKFRQYFLIFIFGLLLSACQPTSEHNQNLTINQQAYTLHMGEQGIQDFSKYSDDNVDNHPAGVSFRELQLSPPNLGKITIENGSNTLSIEHVFSVLGTQYDKNEGIQVLDIDAGLTKEEFATSEQVYQSYVALMKRINQAGWKNYFFTDAPRIAKEDNIKHLSKSRDVIDPSYIFSFEEWKNIINNSPTKSLGYRLYANGVILDISLKRTAKNERNEEQYMLRFSFQSVRYNERDSISDSDKMTSIEFEQAFKKRLIENKKYREKEERKAKAEGYHIDEEYTDPDVWPYVK
ncbi:hypothetical protein SOI81_01120 [Acinetobacter pittii]|uniref:hypothetical protein n=1 Tax=Acinetobacter pittii TaxID=48296 RepID=UPI002A6AC9AD|nr:hypothetical protein [Acinetobacter pittii]WPP70306.1 hypothetical protein SOI81_01120 [Acinetobacter pittii]